MAKKKKEQGDPIKLEHARLAWQILGAKFLYYEGQNHKIPSSAIPADELYDKWEERYKFLCKQLGVKSTASDMVGFDKTRPSCQMVMQHLIHTKGKCPMALNKAKEPSSKENPIQEVRKEVNVYLKTLNAVLEEVGISEEKAKKIRIKMKKRLNP